MVVASDRLEKSLEALVDQNRTMNEQMQKMAEQMQKMAEMLEKAHCRKAYHKDYYSRRKEEKAENKKIAADRLEVPNKCIFQATGLPLKKWVDKMVKFHELGKSPENFLTWLAWSWNKNTFTLPPITRSGGYNNVLIGKTGDKGLRARYTESDMFPTVRFPKFTKMVQLDAFHSCKWWRFGARVLGKVYLLADDMEIFNKFRPRFQKLIRVMVGSTGECPAGDGECFDQNQDDMVVMNRTFRKVRFALESAVAACKKGLFMKEEPFTAHFQ